MSPVSDEFQAEDLKAGDAAYSDGEREQIYQAAMDFWIIMLYLCGCDHYYMVNYSCITIDLCMGISYEYRYYIFGFRCAYLFGYDSIYGCYNGSLTIF